jgi:phosphatidylglycerol:prolipoprotein diacylglycerol transferase
MYPELFRIPLLGKGVPAYGTALMLGFLLAVLICRRRAGSLGLEPAHIFDMGFFAVIGGIVGARLLHVLLNLGFYFTPANWPKWMGPMGWLGAILATWNGGLVFYGGLGGAILALWIFARRSRLPFPDVLDFAAPGSILGLAVTRVGCFLNGCCFGKPCDLPWAVRFPASSHVHAQQVLGGLIGPGDPTLPVHPTQLYEALAALGIFAVLWALYPRRRFSGQVAWTYGMLYSAWRFVNEFFRADSGPWRPKIFGKLRDLGPLTVFQYMSIPLLGFFATLLVLGWLRGKPRFSPPPAEGAGNGGGKRESAS